MKYNQPYGISDPAAPYINGNPSTGTMGSIPPAASIEFPQREIVNLIAASGLTPDNSDLLQLARSVQSGKVVYGVDTGSATAYAVALNPPLLGYSDGLAVWVLPANSNSGPATFNVNGLGARNIVRRGGAALSAGDMPQGYKSLLTYNAIHANFELYGTGFTPAGFLPVLTANTTLYVNGATGDDSLYDGTTATVSGPHGPFKTISRAMTETFKYGPSVYTMTVNVAAGTYNETCSTPAVRGPSMIINGAGATNTFVVAPVNQHAFFCGFANTMTVQNICGSTPAGGTPSPPGIFTAYNGGFMVTNNTASGSAGNGGPVFWADNSGLQIIGNHTFNAGSTVGMLFFAAMAIQALYLSGGAVTTYTFGGSVACTGAAAVVANGSIWNSGEPYTSVFANAGFCTGFKFNGSMNGVFNTNGHGLNWFPGSGAGTLSTGAQYL